MKWVQTVAFLSMPLFVFASLVQAQETTGVGPILENVGFRVNFESEEIDVFRAPKESFEKTWNWRLGIDDDLKPLKSLIQIAIKHAETLLAGKMSSPSLVGIDWRILDEGRWIMEAHFVAGPLPSANGGLMVKDGARYFEVYLLPDGALITKSSRKPTLEEKGLYHLPLSKKETEELETLRKQRGRSVDPFAK